MSYKIINNGIENLKPVEIDLELMEEITWNIFYELNNICESVDSLYKKKAEGPCIIYSDTVELKKDNGKEIAVHVYVTHDTRSVHTTGGYLTKKHDYGYVLHKLKRFNKLKYPSFGDKYRPNIRKKDNECIVIGICKNYFDYMEVNDLMSSVCHEFTHAIDSKTKDYKIIGKTSEDKYNSYANKREELVALINEIIGQIYINKEYLKKDEKKYSFYSLLYNPQYVNTYTSNMFGQYLLWQNRIQAKAIIESWIEKKLGVELIK